MVAGLLAFEGLLDLRQEVFAAEEELDGLGEIVDRLALGIGELPRQGDDARCGDLHPKDDRTSPWTMTACTSMNPLRFWAA
jgi:hypothetical protein